MEESDDTVTITEATAVVGALGRGVPRDRSVGAFTGVFVPTVLSIFGVVLYLRIGWVVGNAGLGGALGILGVALVLSICTGLSLASLASNTRGGDGGTFAILKRAVGFEVASAIGVPLFLTRPVAIAFYIFGFREGMLWLASDLVPLTVDLVTFTVLFAVAYRGSGLATVLQIGVLAVIGAGVVSILAAPPMLSSPIEIDWWGSYTGFAGMGLGGNEFWGVFAIFFPATTGFLMGTPDRVRLSDPRRSVPRGILAAIVLSGLVYAAILVWCAQIGTATDLVGDPLLVIERSMSPLLVVMGLLGATASSALALLISGPRILSSLGDNGVGPFADAMAERHQGHPRNAALFTAVLTLGCLMLRDLDAIAFLMTLTFLVAYLVINLVTLVETRLAVISFRPALALPWVVPATGLATSTLALFLINPLVGLLAGVGMVGVMVHIRRHGVEGDDEHSRLFAAAVEWGAAHLRAEDLDNPTGWKPRLLVPVIDAQQLRTTYRLLMELARPEGSVRFLGLGNADRADDLERRLSHLCLSMQERGVRSTWSMVDVDPFEQALHVGAVVLQGAFLRPNLMFLRFDGDRQARRQTSLSIRVAESLHIGLAIYVPHEGEEPGLDLGDLAAPEGPSPGKTLRLWVFRGERTWDPHDVFRHGNLDLVLLMGLRLARLWRGPTELATLVPSEDQEDRAMDFLDAVADLARLPRRVDRKVWIGDPGTAVAEAPSVDLSILGFPDGRPDLGWAEAIVQRSRSTCLFVADSGKESALR